MTVKNSSYICTAVKPEQYPQSAMPEIAFVGRSNVGKSSIINALMNRRNLARTSSTPGKTREINFYNVDDVVCFVDLPGYGYASVSKDKKKSWGEVIERYLSTRQQLKTVMLLVDIRHLPSADDKLMYDWVKANDVPHFMVATKADKIPRSQVNIKTKQIREFLGLSEGIKLIPFSSETKQGKEEVWEQISTWAGL